METAHTTRPARRGGRAGFRAYQHLVRSDRILDLWMLGVLIGCGGRRRLVHAISNAPVVLDALRITDVDPSNTAQLGQAVGRLWVTYRRLKMTSGRRRLPSPLASNMAVLAKKIRLSAVERRILALAVLLQTDENLRAVAETLGSQYGTVAKQIRQIVQAPLGEVHRALSPSGVLSRCGLLESRPGPYLSRNLALAHSSLQRLATDRSIDTQSLLAGIVDRAPGTHLTASDYGHLKPSPAAISALLGEAIASGRRGVNVLLHGAPGSGKTEFARVLAKQLGVPLHEVASADVSGEPLMARARLSAAAIAQTLLFDQAALVVFDEIDAVFNDGSSLFGKPTTAEQAKHWVIDLLENNKVPAIWVANRINRMDPAFIRRFDLVLEMDAPPLAARRALLERTCPYLGGRDAEFLAGAEEVTPAVVTRSASVVERMGIPDAMKAPVLETVIDGVLIAQGHRSLKSRDRCQGLDGFDLAYCNADADLERLATGLIQRGQGRILLHGPPGTGKTAFGRWLAGQMGRRHMLKRVSDLQSPWLGEMERNLAKTFDEAMREGALLQMDEVDSYLQDRRNAHRGWEVSQVNEFLTQLERFEGLFIASTNLMDGLDKAALRRFDVKIRLDYMNRSQVLDLLLATAKAIGFAEVELTHVTREAGDLDRLTPGDFAVIRRKHQLTPLGSFIELLAALAMEQAGKGQASRRIGFL